MRDILDSIVMQRMGDAGKGTEYLDMPEFAGQVQDSYKRVKLNNSEMGLRIIGITSSLLNKYESIKINGDSCEISLCMGEQATNVPITKNRLRMLKALALEQMSACQEYSAIVAGIFNSYLSQLLCQAAGKMPEGAVVGDFTKEVYESPLEESICKAFTECISAIC